MHRIDDWVRLGQGVLCSIQKGQIRVLEILQDGVEAAHKEDALVTAGLETCEVT